MTINCIVSFGPNSSKLQTQLPFECIHVYTFYLDYLYMYFKSRTVYLYKIVFIFVVLM